MTDQEYRDFMWNPENVGNCAECPENHGDQRDPRHPCGQQNCWVVCHIKADREAKD